LLDVNFSDPLATEFLLREFLARVALKVPENIFGVSISLFEDEILKPAMGI